MFGPGLAVMIPHTVFMNPNARVDMNYFQHIHGTVQVQYNQPQQAFHHYNQPLHLPRSQHQMINQANSALPYQSHSPFLTNQIQNQSQMNNQPTVPTTQQIQENSRRLIESRPVSQFGPIKRWLAGLPEDGEYAPTDPGTEKDISMDSLEEAVTPKDSDDQPKLTTTKYEADNEIVGQKLTSRPSTKVRTKGAARAKQAKVFKRDPIRTRARTRQEQNKKKLMEVLDADMDDS